MKNIYLIPIFVILAGCSHLDTEITSANNHIIMPHYSFSVPPNKGWHIKIIGGKYEVVQVKKRIGSVVFKMRLMRNLVLNEKLKRSSAKFISKDFREHEKRIMIQQGVDKGLYKLNDVTMKEKEIGRKIFYTMSYVIKKTTYNQNSELYLFFPKVKNNDNFIVAHYSESIHVNLSNVKTHKPDFLNVLETLSVK